MANVKDEGVANEDADDSDGGIFKVDTVPPPAGESDAYNAPTKIGPMAASVVKEMMHAAERKAVELSQRADAAASTAKTQPPPAQKAVLPLSKPASQGGQPHEDELLEELSRSPPAPIPRLHEDEDDEDNAATMLSLSAKAPLAVAVAQPGARALPPEPSQTPAPNSMPVPALFGAPRPASGLSFFLVATMAVGATIFVVGLILILWE